MSGTSAWRIVVFVACLAILVAGCRPGVGGASELLPRGTRPICKVGLVGPFEGLLRWEGYRLLYAVKLALHEANARGGVGGCSIALVALNDGDDADLAGRCADEMTVDADVIAVIGHFSNGTTLAALPTYARSGLTLVSPLATAEGLNGSGGVVLLAPGDEVLAGEALAAMGGADPPPGIEFEGGASWPSGWGNAVHSRVAARWTEARVREEPGWAVMGSADTLEALEDLDLPHSLGSEAPLGHWVSPDVCHLTMANLLGEGPSPVYCQALADVGPGSERWEAFAERYRSYSGMTPTVRAGLVYDATWAVLRGLEIALQDGKDPAGVRQRMAHALAEVSFEGVTGPVAFDGEGRRVGAVGQVWQIAPEVACFTCGEEQDAVGGP